LKRRHRIHRDHIGSVGIGRSARRRRFGRTVSCRRNFRFGRNIPRRVRI
jgi:hypothetical protein